jgi:hypothetical protein
MLYFNGFKCLLKSSFHKENALNSAQNSGRQILVANQERRLFVKGVHGAKLLQVGPELLPQMGMI